MSIANLAASIIFGSIGLGPFIYGKKQSNFKVLGIGIAYLEKHKKDPKKIPDDVGFWKMMPQLKGKK